MKRFFSNLTLNARLGLVLGAFGLGALLIGNPDAGSTVSLDPVELSRIVQTETDHVSVEELADWIVRGTEDFRLVDLRSEAEFASYHIPGAENVPLTALADYGLLRNEKIVLCSEGGIHSAQAWFLLKAHGYRGVYLLRGGLEEWKDAILFPQLSSTATPEEHAAFEKKKELSTFFGGTPVTTNAPEEKRTAIVTPTPPMPSSPATGASPGRAGTKKKKEGC
jgi:rhodanese-related sulfurtransferase